jgi:hypothetical protein
VDGRSPKREIARSARQVTNAQLEKSKTAARIEFGGRFDFPDQGCSIGSKFKIQQTFKIKIGIP